MGTGWRRAFCTTASRETSAASAAAGNNPPTPRLRCKTTSNKNKADSAISPKLEYCKITPKYMNPSSPRSPFSILKNTVLRLSRNSCGVCTHSVKTGLGTAIFTAECSHVFHFPCIASHVRKQGGLICPVCSTLWKDVPLLAIHTRNQVAVEEEETVLAGTPHKRAAVSAANFVPVPENEEAAEFQGFLVNPISRIDLRDVELSLLPEAAVISEGRDRYTYAVVLRVKAPPTPPAHVSAGATRAPIDLVTVLDVSSSMAGAKLGMLKRAMRLVISSLGSADRLSIVAFSAAPRRLLQLTTMTPNSQREARRIIDSLSCSRGCSVAEGLKEATRALEERRERNPVASIILLSDGQDDDGVPSNNERRGSSHTTRFAHVEIPVHSHSSDEDAFSKCVSGLLSVVIHDLRIKLVFPAGSDPAEITAVYSGDKRPLLLGSDTIRLGDLYAEEEKELLVEIRSRSPLVFPVDSRRVISAKCCYKNPTSGEMIYGRDQSLVVPTPETVRSKSPRVEQLRIAFIGSRAVAESRRLIEHCELGSAMQLLLSARALLLQSGSESANEYVKGLEAEMAEVQRQRNYVAGRWPRS